MILSLFGIAVAGGFGLLNDLLAAAIPSDVWSGVQSLAAPLAFLVPPTFASTVPLAFAAVMSFAAIRWLLKIVS